MKIGKKLLALFLTVAMVAMLPTTAAFASTAPPADEDDFTLGTTSFTYDGTAKDPQVEKTNNDVGTIAETYYETTSGMSTPTTTAMPSAAGTYYVYVDVNAGTNGYGAETGIEIGSYTIAPKPIKDEHITVTTPITKEYDGTTDITLAVTINPAAIVAADVGNVNIDVSDSTLERAELGTGNPVTVDPWTLTGTGGAEANYVLEAAKPENLTAEVTQNTTPLTGGTGTLSEWVGEEVSFDLSTLLPNVAPLAFLGTVTYAFSGGAPTKLTGAAIDNDTGILTGTVAGNPGDTEAIGIEITSQNYADVTNGTVNLTVMDKIDDLTFTTTTSVYTGNELDAVASSVSHGSATVTYKYEVDTDAPDNGNARLGTNGKPLTVGAYKVTATAIDGTFKGTKEGTFTVTKATPTDAQITPATATEAYTGDPVAVQVDPATGVEGLGAITVKYNGSTTPPTDVATGIVLTADVAEGANYTAASGLTAGTLDITAVALSSANVTITGGTSPNPVVGETLIAAITDVNPQAGEVTWKWNRNGTAIDGATGPSYVLTLEDSHKDITVTATSTSGNLTGGSVDSNPITVAKADMAGTVTIDYNTSSIFEGTVLTANIDSIQPAAAQTGVTYQWKLNGTDITGATSNSYPIPTGASAGDEYTVVVTAAAAGDYTGSLESSPAIVATRPIDGAVTITRTGVALGDTLTADVSAITPAGAQGGLAYQWMRGGVAIAGATQSTYKIVRDDLGKNITVKVTGAGNYSGEVVSTPVSAAALKSYPITAAVTEYRVGSGQPLVITVDTDFSGFHGVNRNGVMLTRDSQYTAASGSIIVTLLADYLDTLAPGTHRITVMTIDGEVSVDITIREAAPGTTTDTTGTGTGTRSAGGRPGDSTPLGAWLLLLAVCTLGTGATLFALRRRRAFGRR